MPEVLTNLIDWIWRNREWTLSGLVIVIAVGLFKFIRWLAIRGGQRPQTNQTNQDIDYQNVSKSKNVLQAGRDINISTDESASAHIKTQKNLEEEVALNRMMEALRKKGRWTPVERLAHKAALSEEEAKRILRNVSEVVFNKGTDGRTIAKLKNTNSTKEDGETDS